ncbi:MAG: tyrosine protein kinase, partial [Clostridiales bacterium]|nr:tyrosine protein kinase [Clostridiales bacterium]
MKYIEIKKPELDYYSSEACKALRTNLQFCGSDKKAIVFTSCTQNEGKTYVILNLAISLSEIGKKVLLLDADLRKSALLGRVEVSSEMKGLTHFLSKQASLVD